MQNARFISIVLAVAVLVAAWLGFEYLSQVDRSGNVRQAPDQLPAEHTAAPTMPSKDVPQASANNALAPSSPPAAQASVIHKCSAGGKIAYSDQPCAVGSSMKTIEPRLETAGIFPGRSYQEQLAAMEAERRSVIPPKPVAMETSQQTQRVATESACNDIDRQIAIIDARLRQPHGPQEGDVWTAERRKLMDRRFSLGSKGSYEQRGAPPRGC